MSLSLRKKGFLGLISRHNAMLSIVKTDGSNYVKLTEKLLNIKEAMKIFWVLFCNVMETEKF